jgi:hypothetical protein
VVCDWRSNLAWSYLALPRREIVPAVAPRQAFAANLGPNRTGRDAQLPRDLWPGRAFRPTPLEPRSPFLRPFVVVTPGARSVRSTIAIDGSLFNNLSTLQRRRNEGDLVVVGRPWHGRKRGSFHQDTVPKAMARQSVSPRGRPSAADARRA